MIHYVTCNTKQKFSCAGEELTISYVDPEDSIRGEQLYRKYGTHITFFSFPLSRTLTLWCSPYDEASLPVRPLSISLSSVFAFIIILLFTQGSCVTAANARPRLPNSENNNSKNNSNTNGHSTCSKRRLYIHYKKTILCFASLSNQYPQLWKDTIFFRVSLSQWLCTKCTAIHVRGYDGSSFGPL